MLAHIVAAKRAVAPVDSNDTITGDVLCIRCGHSLKNQFANQRCQNCLHPNSDSVYGDYLIHSDRDVVWRLYDTATSIIYGALLVGGLIAIATLVSLFSAPSVPASIERAFDMLFTGAMICPILSFVGITLLTRRHYLAYYRARYANRRFVSRSSVVLAILLAGVIACTFFAPRSVEVIVLTGWTTIPPAMFMQGLVGLMRRVPNLKLAGYAGGAMLGVCCLGVLACTVLLLRPLAMGDPDWEGALMALTVLTAVGGIAMGAACLRLLYFVRTTLRVAARA